MFLVSRSPIQSSLTGQVRLKARKEEANQTGAAIEVLHFGSEILKVYSSLVYFELEVFIQRTQPNRILEV